MLVLWLFQALVGAAAIAASAFAATSLIRRNRAASFHLALAGAFSFVFFVSVPKIHVEMVLVSILAIAAGALLMPVENSRSTSQLLDDDVDVGDSTLSKRLKR